MRRRVVVVVMDGMRRDLISPGDTPTLWALGGQAESFPQYRTVFPSCTRVAAASLATGCWPAHHGLQGNTVALMENGVLTPRDVGAPDFFAHKRRVTGRTLAVPTLAERLRDAGGAIIFSNVSPGGAYAHDPDGHGHVYHRAGSFGPGRSPLVGAQHLNVTPDPAGDRRMTRRFVAEVVEDRRPALALLWLGEPDHTQHDFPLGSPEHRAAMAHADADVAAVWESVRRLRGQGEEILLLVGSDHGHQSVTGIVDVEAELIEAGLKAGLGSGDVLAISNGTSVLVYVHPDHAGRLDDLAAFLRSADWAGRVVDPSGLEGIGLGAESGLAFAVSLRAGAEANAFGIPGWSLAGKPLAGKPDRLGCGQHGGLAAFEQAPFLLASGDGFAPGAARAEPACIIDLAPTVLRHLSLPCDGLDGTALQRGAAGAGG